MSYVGWAGRDPFRIIVARAYATDVDMFAVKWWGESCPKWVRACVGILERLNANRKLFSGTIKM